MKQNVVILTILLIVIAALAYVYADTQNLGGVNMRRAPLPNHTGVTQTDAALKKYIITSNLKIVDFGWISNDQVYYGIGGNPKLSNMESTEDINQTVWYSQDVKNQEPPKIIKPYIGLSQDQLKTLEHGQSLRLLYMTISPSREKVVYTRLPDNYERPESILHDFIDPAELWITENLLGFQGERKTYALLDKKNQLYDCGSALSSESQWFSDETIVIGSCYFPYGIVREYFLADLLSRKTQFLNFENEVGEYMPSEEIAIAHSRPSLAFYTEKGFWMVLVEKDAREIPLKLTKSNLLFNDQPGIAPIWSSDDQWIYYWTFSQPTKYDENGFVEYQPWWLEKMNVTTMERKVVLSENQLLSLLGYDVYRRNTPLGAGNPWKLSWEERNILLFLSETVDTPSELLLISW